METRWWLRGMLWNWCYVFIIFLTPIFFFNLLSLKSFVHEVMIAPMAVLGNAVGMMAVSAILAMISTIGGLFFYGIPLWLVNKVNLHRSFGLYVLWTFGGTIISVFLLLWPAVSALLKASIMEHQYPLQEQRRLLLIDLLQVMGGGLLYAGSGLGYVWAYWRHLKRSEGAR